MPLEPTVNSMEIGLDRPFLMRDIESDRSYVVTFRPDACARMRELNYTSRDDIVRIASDKFDHVPTSWSALEILPNDIPGRVIALDLPLPSAASNPETRL